MLNHVLTFWRKPSSLARILIALCCGVLLAGCSKTGVSEGGYNQWVEAFSSGRVSRSADIVLVLSNDVSAELRSAAPASSQLRIEPEAAGSFAFTDDHTVAFHAEGGLRRGTVYTVTADLDKWFETSEAEATFRFSVETLPLQLSAEPTGFTPLPGGRQQLDFTVLTADAEEADVVEKVVMVDLGQATWQHSPGGRRHSLTVTLDGSPREGVLNVSTANVPDLNLSANTLAQARVPANDKLDLYNIVYKTDPQRCVEATFTQNLDVRQNMEGLASLDDNYSQQVDVEGNRLLLYPDEGRRGPVRVQFSSAIRSEDGLTLGSALERTVVIGEQKPEVKFLGAGCVVPLEGQVTMPFQSIYLRAVRVKVFKIFADNMGTFLQRSVLNDDGELARVARPVAVSTVYLDEQGADLTRWNTYALDLTRLFAAEPGAIYKVSLTPRWEYTAWPCDSVPVLDRQAVAAADELALRRLCQRFDQGDIWYNGEEERDWEEYRWEERDDPSRPSYYMGEDKGESRNIMATNLGLSAFVGGGQTLRVVCTDLVSAAPRSGVELTAYSMQNRPLGTATTDGEGAADIAYDGLQGAPLYVVASQGRDRAYLRVKPGEQLSTSTFDVGGEHLQEGLQGYLYGERGVWRPGDTLHLGFILCDKLKRLPERHPVTLTLTTPLGQQYRRLTRTQGSRGLYQFDIPTAPSAPTGSWRAQVSVGGATFEKRLRIETIKPNRLKVAVGLPALVRQGAGQSASLHGEWLSGATAGNLRYETTAAFCEVTTTFAKWSGYNFDDHTKVPGLIEVPLSQSSTNAEGDATIGFGNALPTEAPGLLKMQLTTRLFEPSGEFSTDVAQTLYTPYPRLVGMKLPKGEGFLPTNTKNIVSLCAVTPEGKPVGGQSLKVDVYKVNNWWWWSSSRSDMAGFTSETYHTPYKTLTSKTDGEGRAWVELTVPDAGWGNYLLVCRDEAGGHKSTEQIWIDTPYCRHGSDDQEAAAKLTLTTDKSEYTPGEAIRLTFPSLSGARAIVNVCQGARIVETRQVTCSGKQTTVELSASEEMTPSVYLCVNLVQPYTQTLNDLPLRLYGVQPVAINSKTSRLQPTITCASTFKPLTTAEVTVGEATGRAMSYTLAIVDEGLLDLTHFATPNAWAAFNAKEALGVGFYDFYGLVSGAYGGRIEQLFSVGGDEALLSGPKAIVNRFTPLARMLGPFSLEKSQKRTHRLELPNYQGRVRVMVVSTDGSAQGSAEKSVKVTRPLMLLGTAPRQVGVGDETSVSATVFADAGLGGVDVELTATGGLEVVGEKVRSVTFNDSGDKTVRFLVRAGSAGGTGQLSLRAKSKSSQASWQTPLTIRQVSQKVAETRVVSLSPGKEGTMEGLAGRLDLELSTTQPLNLASRIGELVGYPHGCLEQTVSRAFPQLYLSDFATLTAEQQKAVEANVKAALGKLSDYQTLDGGLAYWPRQSYADLWASAYASLFVSEAALRGYHIDNALNDKLLRYLKSQVRLWRSDDAANAYHVSVALLALSTAGQGDLATMNRMKEAIGNKKVPDTANGSVFSDATAALSAAYSQSGRSDVAKVLAQGAQAGSPFLLMFKAPLPSQAQSTAETLRQAVSSDRWLSTYETSLDLCALAKWYAANPPAQGLRVKVAAPGSTSLTAESGKSTWRGDVELVKAGAVKLTNEGKGTVYAQGTFFTPKTQEPVAATANGLEVSVVYESSSGRRLDAAALQSGEVYQASISVRNTTGQSQEHVAVTHIVAAGCEILRATPGANVSYTDLRDDRLLAYADRLPAGATLSITVQLSATYAGSYYRPATTAELMYDARVMGCDASGSLSINE